MMDAICRLCSSTKFVNNHIFDEENALFLKMSLYLPIKVLKNDRLPQRICDRCSCKVNDFYQFCNEALEVQARLRSILFASGIQLKELNNDHCQNASSPPATNLTLFHEQGTQTEFDVPLKDLDLENEVKVKEEKIEPKPASPQISVKVENEYSEDESYRPTNGGFSDDSDDLSLLSLKEIKKNENDTDKIKNGDLQENKRGRKRKGKLKDLEQLINSLPGTNISISHTDIVKVEKDDIDESKDLTTQNNRKAKRQEPQQDVYQCCICLEKFDKRSDILLHYKSHASPPTGGPDAAPPPPPQPPARPLKCPRCKKSLQEGEWGSHWTRHWERDRQPFRCGLCEKTFRDSYQLFRHGLSHETAATGPSAPSDKRFMCDLCPEGFVFMRCLLAHRSQRHPEAGGRAVALRCPRCLRAFAHTNSLRRHLRSHTGERNFLCNVCGKALSSGEHLKHHIRIHTGDKPNVCRVCGKAFVKKCNLTLHERVHSGEKPHVCSHCGKAFSQRSTLIIHERYHSGARPYACGVCGRGFVSRGLLTMHLKSRCYAPDA